MDVDLILASLMGAGLFGYLVFALFYPEKLQ